MFCRNCGAPYVSDEAVICVKCGTQKGMGMNFCPACGQQTPPGTMVCLHCGVGFDNYAAKSDKSKMAAGLLGIFLGCFGVHNFYLGYTGKAVGQLVLCIVGILLSCLGIGFLMITGAGIWGLVEGIMILTGSIKTDAKGNMLKD